MKHLKRFKVFEAFLDQDGKDTGIEGGEKVIKKGYKTGAGDVPERQGVIKNFKYSNDNKSTIIFVKWNDGGITEYDLNKFKEKFTKDNGVFREKFKK